ncbi:hypothetical protein B0F90DRAFT_1726140 [Multifurca ochricompacta]|uniref:Uncharacterized protein n=1 Tax=Multifurca ochricompacta TaxID=376703 RepID=A0AAD4M2X0_9AGAM|nr:hypothetical protein B0F90DRAFT_1726140 [Multifurca ochricompacta]
MSDPNPATELLLLLYDTYLATVYSHLVVGIVFGTYVVLYGTSLYILLRNNGMLRSFPRLFMLFITSVMFVLGLIALVLKTFLDFQQFTRLLSPSSSSLWSLRSTNIVTAVSATLARIIYILSDTVCAWRAAVLWNYERRIVGALALFILGTTAAAGSDLGLNLEPLFSSSHQSTQGESHGKLGERALIFVGPTLATNILSTSLIGIKVWKHRRVLMKYLSKSSIAIRTENVFAMLIESGFVYCWIWILYLISTFRVLPDPGFAVMDAVLLYVSVRPHFLSCLFIADLMETGGLPNDYRHLCYVKKITNVHYNQSHSEHPLFASTARDKNTHVNDVHTTTFWPWPKQI